MDPPQTDQENRLFSQKKVRKNEVCSSNSSNVLKLDAESGANLPCRDDIQLVQVVPAHSQGSPMSSEDSTTDVPLSQEESSTDGIDKPQDQAKAMKDVIDKPHAQVPKQLKKATKDKVKNTWTKSTRAAKNKPKKFFGSEEPRMKQLLLENCFAAASKTLGDRAVCA